MLGLGAAGSLLFAFAALRLFALHRARVGVRMLTAVTLALVLLGDALAVTPIGRTWQASWWEWHLLMAAAFVAIAWTLRAELQRESGRAGLLDGLALDATLERVRRDDGAALENLVDALESVDGPRHRRRAGPAHGGRRGAALRAHRPAGAVADGGRARAARQPPPLPGAGRAVPSYLSPDVAAALVSEPSLASLGGVDREISVLHADLSGFTAFAESRSPAEVVDMLNAYFAAVVPPILAEGGTITMFAGDAVMALFGAPATQPDHARRACRAARGLLAAAEGTAAAGWPQFRVGVSTGRAIVGNIGSDALRSYTAIGDTVNIAARLEAAAPGRRHLHQRGHPCRPGRRARHLPRGEVVVKGRADPVAAHLLQR